jgi:glutathione peroxidase
MKLPLILLSAAVVAGFFMAANSMPTTPEVASVHEFKVKTITGEMVSLSKYKSKKLLIVNTASQCGYTPQYADLQKLQDQYGSKLQVLGFPANNFGGQEPGTNKEIASFCTKNYGVTFPMFEKVDVVGANAAPLFKYLSDKSQNGVSGDAPKWNFCKYLVDENGKLMKFFPSSTKPLDKDITGLL